MKGHLQTGFWWQQMYVRDVSYHHSCSYWVLSGWWGRWQEKWVLHWTFATALEDIDFANEFSLTSHTQKYMREKTDKLKQEGYKMGPKITQNNSNIIRIINKRNISQQ